MRLTPAAEARLSNAITWVAAAILLAVGIAASVDSVRRAYAQAQPSPVGAAVAAIAPPDATHPAAALAPLPQCTPVLITLHSYTRGLVETDGCLLAWHYAGAVDGMTLAMVSPDNLSRDGIFRNGFEVLAP